MKTKYKTNNKQTNKQTKRTNKPTILTDRAWCKEKVTKLKTVLLCATLFLPKCSTKPNKVKHNKK
jgi:hypothetical protein